jgi:hypothetical protein
LDDTYPIGLLQQQNFSQSPPNQEMAPAPQIEMRPSAPTPPVQWKQQAGLPQEIAQKRKFTHPAFNGGWQRDEDVDDRRMMIRRMYVFRRR